MVVLPTSGFWIGLVAWMMPFADFCDCIALKKPWALCQAQVLRNCCLFPRNIERPVTQYAWENVGGLACLSI